MAEITSYLGSLQFSQRKLYGIQDSQGNNIIGYEASPEEVTRIVDQGNIDQVFDVLGPTVPNGSIKFAVLGQYTSGSNQFNPGVLSTDNSSQTNGNQRVAKDIINNPTFYSTITGNSATTAQSSPEAGSDGKGDPNEVTSSPSGNNTFTGQLASTINTFTTELRYPLDISSFQDRIVFNAVTVEKKSLSNTSTSVDTTSQTAVQTNTPTASESTTQQEQNEAITSASNEALPSSILFGKTLGKDNNYSLVSNEPTVILGTQAPILSTLGSEWGGFDINSLQLAIANASKALIDSGTPQDTFKIAETAMNEVFQTIGTNSDTISQIMAGYAGGLDPNQIFQRVSRQILNPNLELLFNRPTLRSFVFQFNLSAREEKESKDIKRIIKFFRKNMVPRNDVGTLFVQVPNVFTIRYINGQDGKNHPSINLISPSENKKACALISCDVDYTPMGTYMTFNDPESSMFNYRLTLQFQEIQAIYSGDFDEVKDHSIGY